MSQAEYYLHRRVCRHGSCLLCPAVVNRNFIKASMPWTEEIAMYSMIYMALWEQIRSS